MNKITATGRVVADAEVRFTPGGDAICNFRVASDVGYGDKKTTNWFNCQVWGKRGEAIAQHLIKGQQVTVFGTLQLREWTNKEGAKQLSPDSRVDEIELQGSKQSSEAAPAREPVARQRQSAVPQSGGDRFPNDEDIPFAPITRRALNSI
jgi:single-strand DNA-binding protein